MSTKERLAAALRESSAPPVMVDRALAGGYDDFEAESATPISDLVTDCRMAGLIALAQRAIDGEFDSTKEEAEAWRRRETAKRGDPLRSTSGQLMAFMLGAASAAAPYVRDAGIPPGYACTRCRETGAHAPDCAPPRGFRKA